MGARFLPEFSAGGYSEFVVSGKSCSERTMGLFLSCLDGSDAGYLTFHLDSHFQTAFETGGKADSTAPRMDVGICKLVLGVTTPPTITQ
jgi:hypothetical protein